MRDPNQIVFFDTTLRDGEQSPGCTMHLDEKLRMAHQIVTWASTFLRPDLQSRQKVTSQP